MRRAALLLVLVSGVAGAQKRSVSRGRIAGEVAAGFVGVPVGFLVGYTVGSGFQPHGSSNTGVALGLIGALAGPAGGVNWVGNGGPSHGNFGAAMGGAALGYAATYLLFPQVTKVPTTKLKILASMAAFTLPAVGATIAYNATRK